MNSSIDVSIPDGSKAIPRFSEAIAGNSEMINVVERLCSQIGHTLICCAKSNNKGFHTFVRENMVWLEKGEHPTTTAQCIAAMQDLVGIVGGFKLRAFESPSLPFQAMAARQLDKKALEKLRDALEVLLKSQIDNLVDPSNDPLNSPGLGQLNPFTCAHVFRALVQSKHFSALTSWKALFGMLWALGRKYPNYESSSGVSMPDSLPTAFGTSRCIDAVELLVDTLRRRWKRMNSLIKLIESLRELDDERGIELKKQADAWIKHQRLALKAQISECLEEFTLDAALPELFRHWNIGIKNTSEFDFRTLEKTFLDAITSSPDAVTQTPKNISDNLQDMNKTYLNPITFIHKAFSRASLQQPNSGVPKRAPKFENILKKLPGGLVDDGYQKNHSAYRANQNDELGKYWLDHRNAATAALQTCDDIGKFLGQTIAEYNNGEKDLVEKLRSAVKGLDNQERKLRDFLRGPIASSEGVMYQQLAWARSARMGEFDPAELAHAARIAVRYGSARNASAVLEAVAVICKNQNADGNWTCTQPFFWNSSGLAAYPHSAEVAWALVSIMRTLSESPERYGLGPTEALARLRVGDEALKRFLGWLLVTAREYATPDLFRQATANPTDQEDVIFGWCSDGTPEPTLVHTWMTANVAEFLVEFRAYLQDQINAHLRAEFLSYHPADLEPLSSFENFIPPDLGTDYGERVVTKLWEVLRPHIRRAKYETSWFPSMDYSKNKKADFYSAILSGPPGTAKTTLARRIAGELQWPLIVLTPSDFLAAGEGQVEARAKKIFQSLSEGSRLVYFFDEIDELILDRGTQKEQHRSVFSFLTPSFLTKLQDLHDAAEVKSFIFLICTNYLDRIDSAAKRRGRIDETFTVLYADEASRRAMIVYLLGKKLDPQDLITLINRTTDTDNLSLNIVSATAMLSYQGLKQVCSSVGDNMLGKDNRPTLDWECIDEKLKLLTQDNEDAVASPEIKLSDFYSKRVGALDEWVQLLDLIPDQNRRLAELVKFCISFEGDWQRYQKDVAAKLAKHRYPTDGTFNATVGTLNTATQDDLRSTDKSTTK